MRTMKDEEMDALLENFGWATVCMVDPDGNPYAIEISYFLDRDEICGLVHPRGQAARCLGGNQSVCVKVCDSDPQCRNYQAVSCFGKAYFESLTGPEEVGRAWDKLAGQLRLRNGEYDIYKNRYLSTGRPLPLLRIMVDKRTGVTSSPQHNDEKIEVSETANAMD